MTDEQRIVYVNSQIACALIEMQSMVAENQMCLLTQQYTPYGEKEFLDLINKYNIHHNGVITELVGH